MRMTFVVEFNFQNGLAMNMKTFSGDRAEVTKWMQDNKVTDGKVLEVMEVRVK